ncbi:unnamed protein product [Porites lobata]|uniref:Uncharacterized protein n=1 Tax=Porites lobata TaxID=104759 RepID=A0ABN8MWJ3_9CNID|nr:unnamed protein product [Porites lobata]
MLKPAYEFYADNRPMTKITVEDVKCEGLWLTHRRPRRNISQIRPYSFGGPPDYTLKPVYQNRLKSDHTRPNPTSDETTTDHRQTRPPPNQTIRTDLHRHTRPQTTIPDYSASNQYRMPSLLSWYRSGALFMGWVKGGI